MHWSADYVGLPWLAGGRDRAGLDCYGLIRLVYREIKGVEIDALSGRYVTAEERSDIEAIVKGEASSGAWTQVREPMPFDVLVFRCMGHESHVGLVVDEGMFLHSTAGKLSAIERYQDGRWKPRLIGIYRHNEIQ